MNILPPAGRTPGVGAQEPHPGNALEAKLLELFPGAMLVEDEDGPPWTTTASGRYGRIDVRDVPLDDDPSEWAPKSTTAGRRSRGGVVSAEPDDDPRHEIDPDEVERLAARARMGGGRGMSTSGPVSLPALLDARVLRAELGVTRAAAEAIMRRLPVVQIEGLRKVYVRREDVVRYLDERTFAKDEVPA